MSGGFWHTAGESGDFGKVSKNSVEFTNQEIHLRVFTQLPLSPSLVWHFQLLGQLLGEFYVAKQREQKLQQQTYVQAVHETGARMTHDVKNLLQSLNVLCAAAERDAAPNAGGELSALMRRQLPAITQRLQQTLDKLQKPDTNNGRFIKADIWWEGLQRSYAGRGIEFAREGSADAVMLPKELFDSAGDNLLQNALRKRQARRIGEHLRELPLRRRHRILGMRQRRAGGLGSPAGADERPGAFGDGVRNRPLPDEPARRDLGLLTAAARERPGAGVLQPARRSAPRRDRLCAPGRAPAAQESAAT